MTMGILVIYSDCSEVDSGIDSVRFALVALGILFTEAQVERSVESGRSASLYTNIFLHSSLLLHFLLLPSRSITGISLVFVNIKS